MANRIWIELEIPSHATDEGVNELGNARAALACNMLTRLGMEPSHYPAVWWNERKNRYCFTTSAAGTFVQADDHGHWFNLDYFGRPLTE